MKAKHGARKTKGSMSAQPEDRARRRGALLQGVTNRPLVEERQEQEKLGPRPDRQLDDAAMSMDETAGAANG